MNELVVNSSTKTMTSLEISVLVESQHGNVCVSIERLAKRGVIQLPPMQKVENKQSTSPNNKVSVYVFSGDQGKRDSIVVVAQLCPEFTARLVDRWQELESQSAVNAVALLNDPAAMRGILLTYTERVIALEEEKKVLAPKAEALDRIALADGNHCITNSAKILQSRPKDVFALLQAKMWIYRRIGGRGWVAYQDKIQQGLLTHKVTTVTDIHTGQEKVVEQVLVTPKGLTKLSAMLGQSLAA